MKKIFFPKRMLSLALSFTLVLMLAACGGTSDAAKSEASAKPAESGASAVSADGREVVNFWYLWGGDEAKIIEDIIAAYNESQDKYQVVGLSTPDQQKIITAISGGSGPDITDDFGGSNTKYANEEISMPLDDLIAQDGFDTSIFLEGALEQQKVDGKIYALPISVNVSALFYNKDLLDAADITELPKTLEELMQMSHDLTKVEDGTVTQLGGLFIPSTSWYTTFTYAFGGNFGTNEEFTPETEGFQKTLEYLEAEVKAHGQEPMYNFISSGTANRYTPQDPFLTGEMAFRIDGPWFTKMAEDAGINVGIMPMPGAEAVGGNGWSPLDSSMLYIPSTSKNVEGAWDFMKYMTTGEGSKLFITKKGDLPATSTLLEDPDVLNGSESYKVFLQVVDSGNTQLFPSSVEAADYMKALQDAVDAVSLGDASAEARQAMIDSVNALR